jgi:hypothetical protein
VLRDADGRARWARDYDLVEDTSAVVARAGMVDCVCGTFAVPGAARRVETLRYVDDRISHNRIYQPKDALTGLAIGFDRTGGPIVACQAADRVGAPCMLTVLKYSP